ncbi:DNA polymerase III subunit delta' [Shewanella youngdeokensis]|uniref:DNA-directed DNA polymerase n=1 Tax=Shewanella youngdeokensis TaxID=2999068 RepID=A0ABZ0JU11_9GAMM|nr:DNA polymerase III subunit delta' [Shewanella sp. DAU334]
MHNLPWLKAAHDGFIAQLNRQQVAHAYLVGLDAGYGGEMLALDMAGAALCSQIGQSGACGNCKSCQLQSANSHPDFYQIEADGSQIKVDQIRTLCQKLTSTSQQGGRRVAVILNCERLNQASANALLKTLEEPGKDIVLLLQANMPSRLMATISSRCQRIQVKIPTRLEVKTWLADALKVSDDFSWCLPVVGGPLALVSAVESGRYQTLLDFRKAWAQSLSSGHLCDTLQIVTEKQVSDAIKVLYLVLHRKLIKDQNLDPLKRTALAAFCADVMQQEKRLSVMSTVNSLGLFEGLIIEYTKLIGR